MLNIAVASTTEQRRKHKADIKFSYINRKSIASPPHHEGGQRLHAFKSRAVCDPSIASFGEQQDARFVQDTPTFGDKRFPSKTRKNGGKCASMNDIKGSIS